MSRTFQSFSLLYRRCRAVHVYHASSKSLHSSRKTARRPRANLVKDCRQQLSLQNRHWRSKSKPWKWRTPVSYPQNMIQQSFLSDGAAKNFRKVEYILQHVLVENIHRQNVMPDQIVTNVGRCDRRHRASQQKIGIAVAFVFRRIANGKGWDRALLTCHKFRVFARVHVQGEVDVRFVRHCLQQMRVRFWNDEWIILTREERLFAFPRSVRKNKFSYRSDLPPTCPLSARCNCCTFRSSATKDRPMPSLVDW